MIYADIIIDISSDKLDRSFQYRVPERLEKKIKAGMVAAIPFGNAGRVRKRLKKSVKSAVEKRLRNPD